FGCVEPSFAAATNILFVQCLVNLSDPLKVSTDIDVTVPMNGLIFQAKAQGGDVSCVPDPLLSQLFNITFRGGINSFAANFPAGLGRGIPVVFSSIRNEPGLAGPQKTTLTSDGNPIKTGGIGLVLTVAKDPVLDVTNNSMSSIDLTSVDAR